MKADPRLASVIVRVNPRGTPWYLADLAAVAPAGAADGFDGKR